MTGDSMTNNNGTNDNGTGDNKWQFWIDRGNTKKVYKTTH
jgi:hypothetical protein